MALEPILSQVFCHSPAPETREWHDLPIARSTLAQLSQLRNVLEAYDEVSPKSLVLKGLFRSVFMQEWDRGHPSGSILSLLTKRETNACTWLIEMTRWLRPSDTVLAFDTEFYRLPGRAATSGSRVCMRSRPLSVTSTVTLSVARRSYSLPRNRRCVTDDADDPLLPRPGVPVLFGYRPTRSKRSEEMPIKHQ